LPNSPRQRTRALLQQDTKRLARLIDENFNTRRSIYNLAPWQIQMVEVARQCGASAKFAGSGGAIIGTYDDEAMYQELNDRLAALGSRVIKPEVQ
jgi:glucuronokinase